MGPTPKDAEALADRYNNEHPHKIGEEHNVCGI